MVNRYKNILMGFWINDFFSYWDKGVFDEAIN
jgi:hypothetical protein